MTSRYIPVAIRRAIQCACDHPERKQEMHHIIPFAMSHKHEDNLVSLCHKCHIKANFLKPKSMAKNAFAMKCTCCGITARTYDALRKRKIEVRYVYEGFDKTIYCCQGCYNHWNNIINKYQWHLKQCMLKKKTGLEATD